MRGFVCAFLLILVLSQPGAAAPHQEGQSYVFLNVFSDRLESRVEILYADLQKVIDLPRIESKSLTLQQLEPHSEAIRAYVKKRLSLLVDGDTTQVNPGDISILETGFGTFVLVTCEILPHFDGRPSEIEVSYDAVFDADPNHRAFVIVQNDWMQGTLQNESGGALLLTPSDRTQRIDLTSGSIFTGFLAMLGLGVWHIWIGIDHILFLLALLLPAVLTHDGKRWQPADRFRTALWNVFAIVSMFTVAHTLTLSLAALEVVNLNSRLVESIIALSIVLVALHNIFPLVPGKDWVIAFGFGLFHGFGFATVLSHLGVGGEHAVISLLAFNVGVEIGQIAVVCAVFPLLYFARKQPWYPRFLVWGSWLLVAISTSWFIERAFEIPMSKYYRKAWRRGTGMLGL